MPLERILTILLLMKVVEAGGRMNLDSVEAQDNLTTDSSEMMKANVKTEESNIGELVLDDEGNFNTKKHTSGPTKTTDSTVSRDQKSPSPWCHKYGKRKKRSRYKLSDELNKKETCRDILTQLDYDIEEQEMDKRSRIELLSYLDAALKNKNIELDMALRHLAKEEENLNERQKVESVNSNEAVLEANIEQLNKRIKDLDERTIRMNKMKEQKLLEQISRVNVTPDSLNRKNINSLHQPSSAKEPSLRGTVTPFHFTKTVEEREPELLVKDLAQKAAIAKQTPETNLRYVPYQMPMPYSDPLQILRLTNPDFATLARPGWLNPGWAGYSPNLYSYPVERQYPQPLLYSALPRLQALPVPLRKV